MGIQVNGCGIGLIGNIFVVNDGVFGVYVFYYDFFFFVFSVFVNVQVLYNVYGIIVDIVVLMDVQ